MKSPPSQQAVPVEVKVALKPNQILLPGYTRVPGDRQIEKKKKGGVGVSRGRKMEDLIIKSYTPLALQMSNTKVSI